MEKNAEDQLARSCEKCIGSTRSLKEEGNILHTVKRRNADCTGHTLCRNCVLKHVTDRQDMREGKTNEKK
jgi:hypothetical protein